MNKHHIINSAMRLLVASGMLFLMIGCSPGNSSANNQERTKVIARGQKLYEAFLNSNARQAKARAQELHDLFSESPSFSKGATYESYGRLHLLEFLFGDETQAALYYQKAKCHYLLFWEELELPQAEILKAIEQYTPERCRQQTFERDRMANGGKEPRYAYEMNEAQRQLLSKGAPE